MLNFFEKIKEYRHMLWLLLWPLILFLFFYIEKTVEAKYIVYSSWDDLIPFVDWFIIPYGSWYFYLMAGFILLGIFSKKDFLHLCMLVYSGHIVCYIFYLLFPNGQDLRPVISGTGMFSTLIQNLYAVDTPTNVFPSLHVYDAIAVYVSSREYLKKHKHYFLLGASFAVMILASLSTIFVKQHSILDIFGAIPLFVILYFLVVKVNRRFFRETEA
ncbi:MAG: phosphatidic acid phosphatase [Clostridia bacterium]|jgi:hypothetical protein|nr:phosphatidic acid phosphatase [Clostridia bacterium]